jgi:hypothetical protein
MEWPPLFPLSPADARELATLVGAPDENAPRIHTSERVVGVLPLLSPHVDAFRQLPGGSLYLDLSGSATVGNGILFNLAKRALISCIWISNQETTAQQFEIGLGNNDDFGYSPSLGSSLVKLYRSNGRRNVGVEAFDELPLFGLVSDDPGGITTPVRKWAGYVPAESTYPVYLDETILGFGDALKVESFGSGIAFDVTYVVKAVLTELADPPKR